MANRDLRESWKILLVQFESNPLSVEGHRADHILDLVTYTPET